MSASSLLVAAYVLTVILVSPLERSPTTATNVAIRSFGDVLEPR